MIAEIKREFSIPADGGANPVSHASPIPANGWPLRPFQIVSLYDLIRFIPLDFWTLVFVLESPGLLNRGKNLNSQSKKAEDAQVFRSDDDDGMIKSVVGSLMDFQAYTVLDKLGLEVSAEAARRIGFRLHSEDESEYPASVFIAQVESLKESIRIEIASRKFVYIPPPGDQYFQKEQLFGEEVFNSFPEARGDVKDAGNSLACGLHTASVYHLMRVAEFGLRRIALKLRVRLIDKKKPMPIEFATWDKVITACKNKIDTIRTKPAGAKRQAGLEFYSDAADHCLFMKEIWRNNASHTRKPYNYAEAVAAFDRVKDFMRFLAVNVP